MHFLNICPYIFSEALAKDSEHLDTCLRKAMTNVKTKLTKQKIRNADNNCPLIENLNNTI